MSLMSLQRDTLDVLKKDGTETKGVMATVSSDSITIVGPPQGLLIEPDDLVRRRMSNGGEETFRVIDPGWHEAFHSIPPSYQMKVQKLGVSEAKAAVQSITYNISGNNARVNNNSTDHSVNTVVISNSVANHISQLRSEIDKAAISEGAKAEARDVVDAVELQISTGKPKKAVLTALLSSLPAVQSITMIGKAIYDVLHAGGHI
jgi:hypothetical protein